MGKFWRVPLFVAIRGPLFLVMLAFPFEALADLNSTVTLQANSTLNLETGAIGATGGDILWNGSTITPQGGATAVHIGDAPFNILSLGVLTFLPGYSNAAILARDLTPNNVFAVRNNARHYAKVLVQANSGGTIRLQFTTFGAAANSSGGPVIVAIQNNSSRIPAGYPNYGIAPSSLFVVVGNGLADPGEPVLQSSEAPGIPLTLNGASISVTVNGVTTRPGIWYTSPGQIAAVLPANTPVGTGTLTVTYKGVASAPAPIQVVPAAVGINFYNASMGVATDAVTGALLTAVNAGAPGQNIVLWTTGLGSDPADSDTIFSTTPHAVNTPLQIYIGGVLAVILYQGASGYPGVNQINVTIPASAPTGCSVPLVAVTGNVVSNTVTLPVRVGGGACVEALTGVNGQQVAAANVRTGLVSVVRTDRPGSSGGRIVSEGANAAFGRYTGLAEAATGVIPSPGGCVEAPVVTGGPVTFNGLDAGTITMTPPPGTAITLGVPLGIKGTYNAILTNGTIPPSGGLFTFQGTGGADVGPFTATVRLSNPLMTWTNQGAAAAVDRSRGLTATWTGGDAGTYVAITGTSGAGGTVAGFTCIAAASDGQFNVPSYILLAMPAGPGAVEVQNIVYSALTAPGLDVGLALGSVSSTVNSTYR